MYKTHLPNSPKLSSLLVLKQQSKDKHLSTKNRRLGEFTKIKLGATVTPKIKMNPKEKCAQFVIVFSDIISQLEFISRALKKILNYA